MALIEIHADMKRAAAALERIAAALERAFPSYDRESHRDIVGIDRISHVTDEKLWETQNSFPGETVEQQ